MAIKSVPPRVTILDRYIFSELFGVFAASLSIVMSILYLEKIHFLSRLILDKGTTVVDFTKLLLYVTPAFLTVSIPLSLLLASLVTFSRLSADNEVTAMRACGIGFQRFLIPVLALSLIIYAIDFYLAVSLQHAGNYKYIKLLRKIITENLTQSLGERVFFDRIKNTVIYINEKPSGSENLNGVFLFDAHNEKKPEYITAEKGRFITVDDQVILKLSDGRIYSGNEDSFRLTGFGKYELVFDANPKDQSKYVFQPREMSIEQIRKRIEERKKRSEPTNGDEVEVYKRFALPFSCIVLALLGAPLGIRNQRGGKYSGIGVGITMIIANYLLLMLAEGLGREGKIAPIIAIWIPNAVMSCLAIYLIYAASKEITPEGFAGWIHFVLKPFKALFIRPQKPGDKI